MRKKILIALLFLILTFQNACNKAPANCCPLILDVYQEPKLVKEYIHNAEIYKKGFEMCFCN